MYFQWRFVRKPDNAERVFLSHQFLLARGVPHEPVFQISSLSHIFVLSCRRICLPCIFKRKSSAQILHVWSITVSNIIFAFRISFRFSVFWNNAYKHLYIFDISDASSKVQNSMQTFKLRHWKHPITRAHTHAHIHVHAHTRARARTNTHTRTRTAHARQYNHTYIILTIHFIHFKTFNICQIVLLCRHF
jgi:hypothetical protein